MATPSGGPGRSPSPWPGLIALASIVAMSAWIVWALNAPIGWPWKALQIGLAGALALLVGGSMGIDSINIFLPLAQFSLGTQGIILGYRHFGRPGAVAGLLGGLVLGPFFAIAATVLFVGLITLFDRSPKAPGASPPRDEPTGRDEPPAPG
ncbi:hypothetical protein AB1L88_07160 [Tautonia sp. JC769]|uniref:hypothetical protein n=1 Tax=Tautonia sp. JC769 TaxID=3232135 RepID=UPI0034587854